MISAEERAVLAVLHASAPPRTTPTYPPFPPASSTSSAASSSTTVVVMRIRVFTNFCTSTEAMHRLERHCESLLLPPFGGGHGGHGHGHGGHGGRRAVLTDGDDYTHAVVVNDATPDLPASIPSHRVLGLAQEPTPYLPVWTAEHKRFVAARVGRYLVGSLACPRYPHLPLLAPPFQRHHSYLWYSVPTASAPTLATKTHLMSFMVSSKNDAPGHRYRRALAMRILDTTHLPVHFYGSGCALLAQRRRRPPGGLGGGHGHGHPFYHPASGGDTRLRGAFRCCDEMLDAYLFHVCIENFCAGLGDDVGEYFSEKVIDPLVRETVPLYLGSAAVETAFPGSTVALTGDIDRDLAVIADVCRRPLDYLRRIDVGAVKRHCNLLYHLPRLFAEMEHAREDDAKYEAAVDDANDDAVTVCPHDTTTK